MKYIVFFLVFYLPALCFSETRYEQRTFIAVAYHDVVDTKAELRSDSVTLDTMVNHFEWLLASGYNPVSIDQLIQASAGTQKLPEKPILLCWDDGYRSFYTHVLPLLKAYNFPAVLALVGNWMSVPAGGEVLYGDELVPREYFLKWQQVKEIAASGLVEIASHSNNLHHGLRADLIGDQLPAAIASKYYPATGTYESKQQQLERLIKDLNGNSSLIEKHSGMRPRVMVWPFGRYNSLALEAAAKSGMNLTLTLDPVAGSLDSLDAVGRVYPTLNPETGAFRESITVVNKQPLRRFFKLKTAQLVEENENKEEKFGLMLERVKNLQPNFVLLEPTVEQSGNIKALFENERYPTVQDRLLRLVWHTNSRAGAEVHLWLGEKLFMRNSHEKNENLIQFFDDMGKAAPCNGLVIDHPNFVRTLFEQQLNPTAVYYSGWDPLQRKRNRAIFLSDSNNKIISTTLSAIDAFQQWQPYLETGLLVPLELFTSASPEILNKVLHYFDYLMIDVRGKNKNLENELLEQLKNEKIPSLKSFLTILFSSDELLQTADFGRRSAMFRSAGVNSWGYADDNFINNTPVLEDVRPFISTRTFPFFPK